MSLLEVRQVSHRFMDGALGLNRVSLAIDEGDFLLLAGKNGSGKTLLMKHLNGLLLPTEGGVYLEGLPITDNLAEARRKIGLVFQDPDNQIVGQTVREDVAFGPENLRLSEEEVDRRTSASLRAVGLLAFAEHAPHRLSGGEKRRLAIAGVLAMEPRIIVFDEPFAALDYPGVRQVLGEIVRLHAEGHTIIVITHEIEKVLTHSTRMVIMDSGRIVRDAEPFELLEEVEAFGIRRPVADERGLAGISWLA